MQPSTKDQSKRPSNQLVNVTTRGKETAAAAKRPRRRQTPRPPRLRRKATEIRRGFREVRGDPSVPPPQWVGDLERTSGDRDGEMEVARTEPCSPALSALIMATAGRSPQSHGNGVQSSLHGDFSQAPWLLYPTPSSISMSLPSQDQPVVTDAMMRTAEALLSRPTSSPSHASHPGRPRHQSLPPISPSSPPMTHPPYGSSSVRLTPPRPSFLARSLSWMQHPLAGQAASAYASSRPDLGIQAHQPHSQEGYIIDYPHPNRTSDPQNRVFLWFLTHFLRVPSASTDGVHRGLSPLKIRFRSAAYGSPSFSEPLLLAYIDGFFYSCGDADAHYQVSTCERRGWQLRPQKTGWR